MKPRRLDPNRFKPETKKFGELPTGAYFKIAGKNFKKVEVDLALDMFNKKYVQMPVYEEVEVEKNPTFVLNY